MNSKLKTLVFVLLLTIPSLLHSQETSNLSVGISVGSTSVASVSYSLSSQWQVSFLSGGVSFGESSTNVYRTAVEVRYFLSGSRVSAYIGVSPGIFGSSDAHFIGVIPIGLQAKLTDDICLQLGLESILIDENQLLIGPSIGFRLKI
jgi:hypothetical protein